MVISSELQAKRFALSILWKTRRFDLCADRTLRRYDGEHLCHSAAVTPTTSVAKVGDAEFTVTFLQPYLRYHIRAASCAERDRWVHALADAIATALGQTAASRSAFHVCPPAPSPASGAALGEHKGRRGQRHAFVARFESHPARDLACPDREFVAELLAHPFYCLASRSSVQRWEVMFRCRSPSQAHAQQWHVHGIDVGLQQRSTLLDRAALCELLVLRLMRFGGVCRVRHPEHHATCVVSRRHFLVSKNLADGVFREGRRLYEQQRFSDAAKSWALAALLQHAASHAFLSDMLWFGRQDVPKDHKRAFNVARAGASVGYNDGDWALYWIRYGR